MASHFISVLISQVKAQELIYTFNLVSNSTEVQIIMEEYLCHKIDYMLIGGLCYPSYQIICFLQIEI
jgi:hypothetical protein